MTDYSLTNKMPAGIIQWFSNQRSNYGNRLREALAYRKQTKLPQVAMVIIPVVAFTLAYIYAAIRFAPADMSPAFHFAHESGLITPLSSLYLAMASAFSIGALVVKMRDKGTDILLWVVMALGFTFLSFDEVIMFHERTSGAINHHASVGIFRNWNDIFVIGYGVIALFIMAMFLPRIMRYRMLPELFAVAFLFYGIHTLLDSTNETTEVTQLIVEESAKLICGTFLALATFTGFLGALWNSAPCEAPDNND